MSEVAICNQALSWLGANLIISLNDPGDEARLCKANYDLARRATLESAAWTFATKRATLAQLAGAPVWGYGVRYQLPADNLRVLSVSDDGHRDTSQEWVVESGTLLCDLQKIYIRYIWNVVDTAKFSPMYVQALAARIAADIAIPLTHDRVLQKDMWGLYDAKISDGATVDNLQGRRQRTRSTRLIGVRNRAGGVGL